MFRNKTFTVKRRFSDFLGLFEKLSEKHGPNGLVVPPPPEKNLLGGCDCSSSCLRFHISAALDVTMVSVSFRDDEDEGGKGRLFLCRLSGEKKRCFGKVS